MFRAIRRFFRKGALFKIIVIVILAYLAFTIIPQFTSCGKQESPTPPTISVAPYQVNTASRIYYARTATRGKESVTMTDYYSMGKNRWELVKGKQELPFDVFGNVTISKRVAQPTPTKK